MRVPHSRRGRQTGFGLASHELIQIASRLADIESISRRIAKYRSNRYTSCIPALEPESIRQMVTLHASAPEALVEALRRLPELELVTDAPESAVIAENLVIPVEPSVVTSDALDSVEASPGRRPLILVNAVLDDRTAARLEDDGIGYVDVTGRAWLPGQRRGRRARESQLYRGRELRSSSLRLAQLLADHPHEPWTQRHLAEWGHSSPVTAASLLQRLEKLRLVERHGQGPGAHRMVADVPAFRRWLAAHGRPRRIKSLSAFVREPDMIPSEVAGHQMALTGAAAAERLGLPVLSRMATPSYRVDAQGDELEQLPALLQGFRTDRGANVSLISDPGRLGLTDARHHGDHLIAPPSRVMLDLHLEPRGEAAASVFLDLWNDREIA